MRILLTGSSGFLGKVFINEFKDLDVVTLARTQSMINVDLSVQIPQLPEVDLVIHAAGKAHAVPDQKLNQQEFFDVNVTGTQNLLLGLENAPSLPKALVFISSVAVYGKEQGVLIAEDEPLLAKEAYGLSKIEAEKRIQNWCEKHHVMCTILRLPLIAGQQAIGNLGAMIKGIQKGYYFDIAGGSARKSIVLASDVAGIILKAAPLGGVYNLTDGYHPSFKELSTVISQQLNKKQPKDIPKGLVKLMALVGDLLGNKAPINSTKLAKITSDLTFDDSLARKKLNWEPNLVLHKFKVKL